VERAAVLTPEQEWDNVVLLARAAGWDKCTVECTERGVDYACLTVNGRSWRRAMTYDKTPAEMVLWMLTDDARNGGAYLRLYSDDKGTTAQ
jgi:hypothetical protein